MKPSDWDEREMIDDVDAVKPDDWDEAQPEQILDEDAGNILIDYFPRYLCTVLTLF